MKDRVFRVSVHFVFASLVVLVLTVAVSQTASAQNCITGTTCPSVPTKFRVDVSDGTTGQLFVSWDTTPSANSYNLQRSTSAGGPWASPLHCSSTDGSGFAATPFGQVCRDNDPSLIVGTTYYYRVSACNANGCSGWAGQPATAYTSNAPVTCNNCNLPSFLGLSTPPIPINPATKAQVDSNVIYAPTAHQFGFRANPTLPPSQQYRGILVVDLPGSGEFASYHPLDYTAQNLGFDAISVNYDSLSAPDVICRGDIPGQDPPHCFDNISQAKLLGTGPCFWNGMGSPPTQLACGFDPQPKSGTSAYYVPVVDDDITMRVSTMLYWLWCNNKDQGNTYWETYLLDNGQPIPKMTSCPNLQYTPAFTPNWSKMILAGHSQGGGMATYAGYMLSVPLVRVINLSAPGYATPIYNSDSKTWTMTPANFYTSHKETPITQMFGLASANDTTRYCVPSKVGANGLSVFGAVWVAMGFTAANSDEEWDLNSSQNTLLCSATSPASPPRPCASFAPLAPANCLGTTSQNFVNWALINQKANGMPGVGHDDTLFIWNEDIYKYMLIATPN